MENKDKPKKQEAIQITEVKEVKPKIEKPKKEEPKKEEPKTEVQPTIVLTLKERITKVVDDSFFECEVNDLIIPKEVKFNLEKKIFALIQRYLHPEQFCPTCDERLFFNAEDSTYGCSNCGYQAKVTTSNQITTPIRKGIPPQVEKIIEQSDKDMKDVPIVRPKTALGDKIKKLVNQRDSGGTSGPTKEDESRIKGQDKNVSSQINWS